MRKALLLLSSLFLFACQDDTSQEMVVARVGEQYLTLKQLGKSIPDNLSAEDSTELAGNVIQGWINRELMFDKAKFNLNMEELDIEERVKQYRQELYIFAYEKELVAQKLDTVISDVEVERFYEENPEIFRLNDYILKVRYVKLRSNSPKLDQVEKWVQSSEEEDLLALDDYCHQYAVKYYNDSNWVYLNDLLRELPIEVYNKDAFLRSDNLVTFEEQDMTYVLWIQEIQSENTLSPIEMERDRIKNLIRNKRRLELLNSIRTNLYKEGRAEGFVEQYEKPQIVE